MEAQIELAVRGRTKDVIGASLARDLSASQWRRDVYTRSVMTTFIEGS